MFRMLLYYVLAMTLYATGLGVVSYSLFQLLFSGLGAVAPGLLLGGGAAPLALGALTRRRARRLRNRIEWRHRASFVRDLARRRGGMLEAAEVARAIEVPPERAQKLLEALARRGEADIEVGEAGQMRFRFDEQRLLGP
jgi:hypothetical protein